MPAMKGKELAQNLVGVICQKLHQIGMLMIDDIHRFRFCIYSA
jgi:hypothetical protein